MTHSFIPGFALGLSLIVAIGAQNAFVLRQGLRRQHVFWICLICALSDAVLIMIGVSGFGALQTLVPGIETVLRFGGAAFLIWYGVRCLKSAARGGAHLDAAPDSGLSLRGAVMTVLAFTWLNPHVYLDTVVLVGSISAQYENRMMFGYGAVVASFTFFFSLGCGARLLAPLFARDRAWQVLDALIGAVMLMLAAKLLWG